VRRRAINVDTRETSVPCERHGTRTPLSGSPGCLLRHVGPFTDYDPL